MAKFKVGDRVRIIADTSIAQGKKKHIGECFVITRYYDEKRSFFNKDSYESDENAYAWFDNELELVKPKFDIKNYKGDYAMRCTTKEHANIFDRYMRTISNRDSHFDWKDYKEKTCYFFNENMYGTDMHNGYTYLNFEDFDWSDFEMKKEFTKKDLKNGDVVKLDRDEVGIICVDTRTITFKDGFDRLGAYTDDLIHEFGAKIMAVRRPRDPGDCQFCAFEHNFGTLVYERKEVEEMTLEEVCKALGKEIKIVKK